MGEELDEEALDALSSETRREILKLLDGSEKNPTFIARKVGKHKSTVAEHLDILQDAGLVERHEVPGRRRVAYSLTRKGRRSVSTRGARVALVSSLVAIGAGVVSVLLGYRRSGQEKEFQAAAAAGGEMMTETVQTAAQTEPILYPVGATLLVLGVLGLFYWSASGR